MRNRAFPDAMFEQPELLPPPPHRDATAEGKEIVTKQFSLRTPVTGGDFSDEITVAILNVACSGVDVYLNIASINGAVESPNGAQFEIAATLYAIAGNTRSVVNRGAYTYYNNTGAVAPFIRDLFAGAARQAAEKFEVTLRVMGAGGFANVPVLGTISMVGYQDPPALIGKPSRGYSVTVGESNLGGVRRPLHLYRIRAMNATAVIQYLQLFDTAANVAPAVGSSPVKTYLIPANSEQEITWEDAPLPFNRGFQCAVSSTPSLYAAPTGAMVMLFDYT